MRRKKSIIAPQTHFPSNPFGKRSGFDFVARLPQGRMISCSANQVIGRAVLWCFSQQADDVQSDRDIAAAGFADRRVRARRNYYCQDVRRACADILEGDGHQPSP